MEGGLANCGRVSRGLTVGGRSGYLGGRKWEEIKMDIMMGEKRKKAYLEKKDSNDL